MNVVLFYEFGTPKIKEEGAVHRAKEIGMRLFTVFRLTDWAESPTYAGCCAWRENALREIAYSKLYELGHGNRRGQQKHPRHVILGSEVLQRSHGVAF